MKKTNYDREVGSSEQLEYRALNARKKTFIEGQLEGKSNLVCNQNQTTETLHSFHKSI